MSIAATPDRDRAHDHVVGFYRRDDELISTISADLAAALEDGGAAIVVATAAHRRQFDAALVSRGFSIESLTDGGRYRSFDAQETLAAFMRDDKPDPDAFASVIGAILEAASRTAAPIHVFGEMVALLWDAGNIAAVIALESLWNDLAADYSFSLYCAYAMSSLEAANDLAAAKQVCDLHSSAIPLDRTAGPVSELIADSDRDERDEFVRLYIPALTVVRDVRQFVRDALQVWGEEGLYDTADLIVSELATNAVIHARSPFRVSISRSRSAIRIAVQDASKDLPKQVRRETKRERGGRGIAVVAALSNTWNTQELPDGKTIWARMTREPAG